MPKGKSVITTRLDQDLVEVAQKRVEEWLDKAGAGRRVSSREAVEYALAAFSPENSEKTENRIIADTVARMFLNLVRMVEKHKLPLDFEINLSGSCLWAIPENDPNDRIRHVLAFSDPEALQNALVEQGAELPPDGFGIFVSGASGHAILIKRELLGIDEVPYPTEAFAHQTLGKKRE